MKNKFLITLFFVWASSAVAQNNREREEEFKVRPSSKGLLSRTEGSEFSIDPKLVDRFFETTTTKEATPEAGSSRVGRVEVGYGHMVPTNMTLQNKYFEVPYSKNQSSIPYGFLQGSKTFLTFGRGSMNAYGMVGYTNQQGIYEVTGSSGIALKDTVTMQWVPLEIGSSVDAKFFSGQLQPGLIAGVGADWISQTGTLDGMNQNYWIPHVSGGPAVTFFGSDDNSSGFDGICLSGLYRSSYGSEQAFKGWSFNLTSRFAM